MRHYSNPYAAHDARDDRKCEEAAYEDAVLERQGDDALRLYNKLPEGMESIFSSQMNKIFGELFDEDDVDGLVNGFLYELSLLEVKRRQT
ncbi:hypothetical protein Xbed_03474 [Xenorhabdus beddingii]|uniref:Uncharacterized protein n=1 Tax=Xenorhabdus beddingii TaxID=40578 RepID=A0A1Y2SD63_9GAMM|nr:hypothetical protein [Xenorhabdus beddingii]OTA16547.1 hypothetical protein Xbed_03474 [Xenorhabdus beddingii]